MEDYIDCFVAEWAKSRPEMKVADVAGLLRALRIGNLLEGELLPLAASGGLKPGQFNILSALRRLDPEPLSPKRLMKSAILSSGAVTPILDKLETMRLLRRLPDPNDRRGVLVTLTEKGRRLIDRLLEQRLARHHELASVLTAAEKAALAALTRKVLLKIEGAAD
jgi:DNA-binding MarR family transcriptional regulator